MWDRFPYLPGGGVGGRTGAGISRPFGSISGGMVRLVWAKESPLCVALPAMSLIRLGVKVPV
jgi:hypothetical protein